MVLAKSEKLKWYLIISDIFKSFGLDHPNVCLTINNIKNHLNSEYFYTRMEKSIAIISWKFETI